MAAMDLPPSLLPKPEPEPEPKVVVEQVGCFLGGPYFRKQKQEFLDWFG